MRYCGRCKLEKPIEMFSWSNKSKGIRQSYCKSCCVALTLDWEQKYPEKKKAAGKLYRQRHADMWRRKTYAWRTANPEAHRVIQARYLKNHPEKNLQWLNARRARKLNAPGFATAEQIMARVEYYGYRCYMCGGPYEHLDHVIPLARGGSNWPANLRPACASCNGHKHDKLPLPVQLKRTYMQIQASAGYC